VIAPAVLARIVAPHRGQSYSRYCEDVTSWQISSHIAWSADVDKLDQGSGRELPRNRGVRQRAREVEAVSWCGKQRHERHERAAPGDYHSRLSRELMIAPATNAKVTSATPPARSPRWVVRSPQMKTMNPRLARSTSPAMTHARTASSTSRRGRGACGPAPRAAARRWRPSMPRDRRSAP